MIDEQRYRALIQQLATGGIAGNKTYHQVRDQYMPMDSESMGYMNGGGIGSMMQPRRNFKLGGGEFEEDQTIGLQNIINSGLSENENTDVAFKPGSALDTQINKLNTLEQMGFPQPNLKNLKEMDMKQFNENGTPLSLSPELYASANNIMSDASKIDVNDLTNRNNKNFLISAANALNDQTGIIDSAPSITNDGVRTMEGSLIDGDDITSRYDVQKNFDSLPPSYNDSRIVSEELGITGYGKPNIRDVAGESTMPFNRDYSLFDLARMGNPNEITDRNRGMNNIGSPTEIDTFSQNFDKNYDASSDALVPGMGKREIDFKDAPADGIFTQNNIARGPIDKNITNRAFNAGTPEATAQFLAANGFPIPENLKQFLEVDTTTGKYVSKKSPNNFMSFMSNIPTPFNLAKKGLDAISGPRRETTGTVYSDSGQAYTPQQLNQMNAKGGYYSEPAREQRRRESRVQNMLDRKAAGKSYSQKNLNKLTTGGSKPGTYTTKGSGSAGSSSGGKSIVCTAMYQTTGLQDWAKAMKVWYIYQKRHLSDAHQEGYHLLFKPFVKGMHKSKIIRAIGAHVAKHRTQELKHIMFNSKSDTLGKIYNKILQPICYLAGKIKSIFS